MSTQADLIKEYDGSKPRYDKLRPMLRRLIKDLLSLSNLGIHKIEARVKKREKTLEKINRKSTEGSGYDKLTDMTDILGARVITLFEDDVDEVARVVEKEFDIDRENSIDKRINPDPTAFGYRSLHFVASISKLRAAQTEYSDFAGMKFEIQIRSILQHAWAEIEHDFGYKGPAGTPREYIRSFSRISSLLEVADQQFVEVRKGIDAYRQSLPEGIKSHPERIRLDQDSISQFFASNETLNEIEENLAANLQMMRVPSSMSELASSILSYHQIKSIEDLGKRLTKYSNPISILATEVISRRLKADPNFPRELGQGVSILYLGYILAYTGESETILQFMRSIKLDEDWKMAASARNINDVLKKMDGLIRI